MGTTAWLPIASLGEPMNVENARMRRLHELLSAWLYTSLGLSTIIFLGPFLVLIPWTGT